MKVLKRIAAPIHQDPKITYQNNDVNKKKYVEYREDLFKYFVKSDDEFYKNIAASKEIGELLENNAIINRLDNLDGLPKLCISLFCKYMAH